MEYNYLSEVLDSEYAKHPEAEVIIDVIFDSITNNDGLQESERDYANRQWLDFILKFGSEGAKGLIGFVQFYKDHDKVLSETICHDIFGRKDLCFLPRSSGYDKYYKGVQNAN